MGPLKPLFQWSPIVGADSYELLVTADASFTNPVIIRVGAYALPGADWQCDISLDYNTTYYWKVRACSSDGYSDWSAVGAFTTELPPEVEPLPDPAPDTASTPPSQSPPYPPTPSQPGIPDWAIYLVGGLALAIILLLVIIVVLVLRMRRL